MLVDVADLNFKELQFNSRYDISRYNRGRAIYDNEDVQITKVNKIDDDNYDVEASVNGQNSTYITTLKIFGSLIKKYSCTCVDYINGNLCKHVVATALEVTNPHYWSKNEGRKRLQEKREKEERERLERLRKIKEEKIKRQEYIDKYSDGLRAIELYKREDAYMRETENLDLMTLYDEVKKSNDKKTSNLSTNIRLEFVMELYDEETISIHLKIGETRMYVLNNLEELYAAYKTETEIYYGKQLRFVPKRENFCEDSKWLFDYIIDYMEMLEYYNSFSRYEFSILNEKEILIKGEKIDEFFRLIPIKKFLFHCYEGNGKNANEMCEMSDEDMEIFCTVQKENVKTYNYFYWENEHEKISNEYVLRLNISNYLCFYSNKNIYIYYKAKIYVKPKETNLLKLLGLFKRKEFILMPEDKLSEFGKFVFPKVRLKTDDLPDELAREVEVVQQLASKILLDTDENGNILLELKFCYSNYEFNILEKNYKTYVKENNIIRDVPAETEVIRRLFLDGFELATGKEHFVMKNLDAMYEFLAYKIQSYMADFEVLATDRFKSKQLRQPKISNIGMRVDNGLLELDISKININIDEIKDILKDYNIKKKYHKLKSGDLLDLTENKDLDLLSEMSTTLDIDYSKIENGIVNLPVNRSFYLERLIDSNKEINVTKNEQFTKLINSIENSEISEDIKIDEEFEGRLRDYQKVGYKWLKTLEKYKFGGILADDMGLGKTLQIIAVLKAEMKSKNKTTSIVVCPSTLVLNWKAEVEKWCGSIKTLIVRGNIEERKEKLDNYQDYDLIITSYDLLKRDIENYEGKSFKYIIADEAQYIKNSLTQNATSLKSLNGEVKFALTGTPIENSIAELWSIFDFIMPGYLYNYNKFKKKFEEQILKYEDKDALARLKKLISPFVLRRVKKEVLTELPEKSITILENEMEEEQEKLYISYLAQTKKEVAEELSDNSFEKSKFKILMLLTRLRQICCHPSLFLENYNGNSGKLKQCLSLIVDAIESGHKILLFSSYTSMFEIIEEELNKLNISYFKLIGDTPVNKRIEMVDEFNKNESIKIFLISLKAGGTGLNLTSADVVIHYDPWWNVSSENQATDRAYRIGQKNSVQVYKLITSNSIEEKINKMQERKEKLSEDILSTEETFISKMSKEEILDLFE